MGALWVQEESEESTTTFVVPLLGQTWSLGGQCSLEGTATLLWAWRSRGGRVGANGACSPPFAVSFWVNKARLSR